MNAFKRLKLGFGFLLSGYKVIMGDRWLKAFSLVPLFICGISFFVGIGIGGQYIPILVNEALMAIFGAAVEGWWSFIIGAVRALFEIVTFLVYGALLLYVVYLTASVLASPFNALIAEKILMKEGLIEDRAFEVKRWLRTSLKMAWVALLRALVLIMFVPLLFLSSFVPGLNLVAGFMAFVLIAFDSADFALEALGMGFKDRFRYLKLHFVEFSGMAGALSLTAFIPGLTVLVMPAAVAGAAKTIAAVEKRKASQ